jgi:hypothetical protein
VRNIFAQLAEIDEGAVGNAAGKRERLRPGSGEEYG